MLQVIVDILKPGGLMARRRRQRQLEKVVDETLLSYQLDPKPTELVKGAKISLSEDEFRQLVTIGQQNLAQYDSKFSRSDLIKEIRRRGYQIKPPEKKTPTWLWLALGTIAALVLMKEKQKEAK